jgi:hypothetical protein
MLAACAMLFAVLSVGCSGVNLNKLVQDPNAAKAAEKAQQLAVAKAAAAKVMADLDACETAVMGGESLNDLSKRATKASQSAQAFSRSPNGKLLPQVASAMSLVAKEYVNSCLVWAADDKAAAEFWLKYGPASGKTSLDECKHPQKYNAIWIQAGVDLGKARVALSDAKL